MHPPTILSTLPSARIGAVFLLWAWGQDFSIMALIGIVLLIGIVRRTASSWSTSPSSPSANEHERRRAISGLPDPFPADHGDHPGRAAGRVTPDDRLRHRFELRQPLGIADIGRRAAGEPGADPVQHAGVYLALGGCSTGAGRRPRTAEPLGRRRHEA